MKPGALYADHRDMCVCGHNYGVHHDRNYGPCQSGCPCPHFTEELLDDIIADLQRIEEALR